MWKKDETTEPVTYPRPEPTTAPARPAAPMEVVARPQATIGSSITIKGDVTGDEDLLIQGRVDGSVDLKQHSVTVGQEGEVKANITGRVIAIEGRVQGNLRADEQVILRSSALVQGDIQAPRVVLENGARFRGGVDMGESLSQGTAQPSAPSKSSQSGRSAHSASTESTRAHNGASSDQSASSSKTESSALKPAEVIS